MPIHRLDHAGKVLPAGRSRRRTRRLPGSTWAWRKVRRAVLERDGWTCVYCGAPATEAHHLTPRRGAPRGADDPDGLVATCLDCNRRQGVRGPVF